MTRDEILKLEAGRELDALVAEKVMGWQNDESVPYFDKVENDGTISHISRRWSPSEDIAATWDVVEMMQKGRPLHKALMLMSHLKPDGEPYNWDAEFGMQRKAIGDTAPLAICRAALLAVMDKENV